jgi:hypothetical protein
LAVKLSNGTANSALTFWDAYLNDPTSFTNNGVRGSNAATPVYQVNVPAHISTRGIFFDPRSPAKRRREKKVQKD